MVLKSFEFHKKSGIAEKPRGFLFFPLLFILSLNLFAEYKFPSNSWIAVIDITKDAKNNLELVEYHLSYVKDRGYYSTSNIAIEHLYNGIFSEYILYNNSDITYIVKLGVAYQYESDMPSELFVINNVPMQHQLGRLAIRNLDGSEWAGPFAALIDIKFQAHETTKIRINDLAFTGGYNEKEKRTEEFVFKGNPRFTVKIGNFEVDNRRRYIRIEEEWINDIIFHKTNESFISMLEKEGSLSNDLFTIRKTNGNTWEIEFTKLFVDRYGYGLIFKIESGSWGRKNAFSEFVFDSTVKIRPYQYMFLTNNQLQIIRNSYYARHGYVFKNNALKKIFEDSESSFGNIYYREDPNFTELMLTDTDRANIATIQRLEALTGN